MRQRWAAALIVLVALAASAAGIGNGFVQDDIPILLEDFRLHDVTLWPRLFVEPYWPPPYAPDQYRPLTSLLLSLQFIAGGGSPVVVRVTSYLLYACVSLGVWRLARVLLPGREVIALIAALLFAAHPVHVEATALGVAQGELLMSLFVVMGVLRYLRMRDTEVIRAGAWVGLGALYLGAALSKEQGLLFPLFLVAAELLLVARPARVAKRELLTGAAILGAVALLVLLLRTSALGAPVSATNVAEALRDSPFRVRLATALQLTPHWLRLLVWPAHLRSDYSPQEFAASPSLGTAELAGLVLIAALAAALWVARGRAPVLSFGIAWMGIGIAPVSNVVLATGVLIAERTLFLPSVGMVLALAGTVAWLAQRPLRRPVAAIATGVASVLVLAGVWRSAVRQGVWRDERSLTLAAIADSPRSWRAQVNHADLLFDAGDLRAAMAAYERAIQLAPSAWQVRHSYARRLRRIGDEEEALTQLGLSLVEEPENPEATRDLIASLLAVGRYMEARAVVAEVIGRGETSAELLRLGRLADSALAVKAPAGSIRIGIER